MCCLNRGNATNFFVINQTATTNLWPIRLHFNATPLLTHTCSAEKNRVRGFFCNSCKCTDCSMTSYIKCRPTCALVSICADIYTPSPHEAHLLLRKRCGWNKTWCLRKSQQSRHEKEMERGGSGQAGVSETCTVLCVCVFVWKETEWKKQK